MVHHLRFIRNSTRALGTLKHIEVEPIACDIETLIQYATGYTRNMLPDWGIFRRNRANQSLWSTSVYGRIDGHVRPLE